MKQFLSYVLTFAVYASMVNWKVALVLMAGVAFHEWGHLLAAKRMGLPTGGFYLLPFIGGVALITGRYTRYSKQAFTVLAGPIFGAILAFVSFGAFLLTGNPIFGQAAIWMAWLNLFNLLPLSQMDGGQILESITFSINETLGVVLMGISTVVAVVILFKVAPILSFLVIVYGGSYLMQTYKAWKWRREGKGYLTTPLPKRQTKIQILYTVLAYMGTVGSLLWLYTMLSNASVSMYDLFK